MHVPLVTTRVIVSQYGVAARRFASPLRGFGHFGGGFPRVPLRFTLGYFRFIPPG